LIIASFYTTNYLCRKLQIS